MRKCFLSKTPSLPALVSIQQLTINLVFVCANVDVLIFLFFVLFDLFGFDVSKVAL